MPLMKVKMAGGSHYQGDIYLDLKSHWLKQFTMTLSKMTQVSMLGLPISKTVPLTHLLIKAVSKDEFDQGQNTLDIHYIRGERVQNKASWKGR